MVSRQVFLLTPSVSSRLRPLPPGHRINRVNRDFTVKHPFCFQMFTTCPFANLFILSSLHFDGGVYPPPSVPSDRNFFRKSFAANSLADPHPLTPVASILYKNTEGQGCGITLQSSSSSVVRPVSVGVPMSPGIFMGGIGVILT